MFIKFYGTRGSLPVSGSLTKKYGGNTTCLYIETSSGDNIVIDAGSGIRELGTYLMEQGRKKIHIIFTHYHWDHIQGFPFFAPIYSPDTEINIYGPNEEVNPKEALSYQMNIPYFPSVNLSNLPARVKFKRLKSKTTIGHLSIQTIPNNHPNFTFGLRFCEDKKVLVFMTDNELCSPNPRTRYEQFLKFIKGANLLIHDAQYDEEQYRNRVGWGHSTYLQVMEFADKGRVRNVIFTHHDPFSEDDFINKRVQEMRKKFSGHTISAARTGTIIKL